MALNENENKVLKNVLELCFSTIGFDYPKKVDKLIEKMNHHINDEWIAWIEREFLRRYKLLHPNSVIPLDLEDIPMWFEKKTGKCFWK